MYAFFRNNLIWAIALGVLSLGSVNLAEEDTFNVTLSSSGSAEGGGSGWNGAQWYYYPTSEYYVQWFYNGPYNPAAYKTVEYYFRIQRVNIYASAWVKIAINWTTDQWTSGSAPPLPGDIGGSSQYENQVISRQTVFEGNVTGSVTLANSFEIQGYCPAWVSVDVQGYNVRVYEGNIVHTCIQDVQYEYDFGDAPYPPYPTLLAQNGARHTIDDRTYLGQYVDAENDGQPNANATGDDNNGLDDEDGVVFTSTLVPGSNADVEVDASTVGLLSAWIDFNADGDWSDADEQIFFDQLLVAGVNSLTFPVPAGAVPGQTFSRWRFSTVAGLNYTGSAINGEVEDHSVRIEPKQIVDGYFKWEQPPIEYDPWGSEPIFCGWDQAAYVVVQGDYGGNYTPYSDWKFVADDFRCVGDAPVTSVHWWGSYVGWTQSGYPTQRPVAWVLGFWSNVPAGIDSTYSHPGKLLHKVAVPANQVDETWAGTDLFPSKPDDTCYKYSTYLNPNQYFWQDQFLGVTNDRVFWLSVTAIYQGAYTPIYPWGWKTRPAPWLDAAVTFTLDRPDFPIGLEPSTSSMTPTQNSAVCDASKYDLAFALDTDPDYVKWNQPFTGLRDWAYYEDRVSMASGSAASGVALKWSQPPDLSANGIDMDATYDSPQTWPPQVLADDFECTLSGPIRKIDVWGSWFSDRLPGNDPTNVQFTVCIHQDIPAGQNILGYSMPGQILWTQTFKPGEFTVTQQDAELQPFYSPCTGLYVPYNHYYAYRYTFDIDVADAFYQQGTALQPVVYWLSVQAQINRAAGTTPSRWGWKTSTDEWNDSAVYARDTSAQGPDWQVLSYPTQHGYYGQKTGLAFEITTEEEQDYLTVQYQVADDWLCDTSYPLTAAVWWGSYQGYYYRSCDCQDQDPPQKPAYFWLSLWTDKPDLYPNDPRTYSEPAELVWEYNAYDYDEVLVGFDRYSGSLGKEDAFEAVYRYSVQIPKSYWFYQPGHEQVYWFSVVAVYSDLTTVPYKWGWTNHRHVYNDYAVTSLFPYVPSGGESVFWTPLYDQTGVGEDMSFMLFTDPKWSGN